MHIGRLVVASAVVVAGCSGAARRETSDPSGLVPATSVISAPATDRTVPDGFARVAATVTEADGESCEICLWLADTGERRAQGLMSVTDLGEADGMAFVYDTPHTGQFWMKDTLLPLSIAFFGVDGRYLEAFDMEPCRVDPCPRYPTPRRFAVAVETTRGDLVELGIGPGSRIELGDLSCD